MAPDPIQIRILHNQNPYAVMDGYMPGDPLTEVYADDQRFLPYREDAIVSLEFIFEQNQWAVEVGKRPWYDEARSVSKGDVLILHDKAYAIAHIGFDLLPVSVEELSVQ